MAKKAKKLSKGIWGTIIAAVLAIVAGITGAVININIEQGKVNASIIYSQENKPTTLLDDRGNIVETTEYNGEQIPTVDEVDGGKFEDETTGVSVTEGEYADLGWAETFNVSTPEAFRDDTLGKCIYANNRYGAQCVSLARVFWWSYADRDVSTCGTGAAKGMMNCADQNAGDEFEVHWGNEGIQDGDWIVSDGGQWGHICMALGPVTNGYVACLGENQGGRSCEKGGAATNIINYNVKNVIGYYRPEAYIKPAPQPAPEPIPEPTPTGDGITYVVKPGDTLGAILRTYGYTGNKLFGNDGVAQKTAEVNGIKDRGLIFPGQTIVIYESLFNI